MKYKRLRITNYRGVQSSEIVFLRDGLTLVQGPNEAGKTSLSEAIYTLFEHPDSANNKHVKSIRPVHQDAGPEIELEAESGPFQFTYFKRFHRKPETTLTISSPATENHTGRDAHDRARAILGETLDVDLWRALAVQQGDAIDQPNLANQQSLSAALDRAAGGVQTDPAEEGLFERATVEFSRYYSEKTGNANRVLKEATDRLELARSRVSEFEKQLSDLDKDIDNAARLQTELQSLGDRETNTRKELGEQTDLLREITMLESQATQARLKLESATKTEALARRDDLERKELIALVDDTEIEYQDSLKASADLDATFEHADRRFTSTSTKLQNDDRKRRDADRLATIRRADVNYYNDQLFLEQLAERKQRIDAARKAAAGAEAFLGRTQINEESLKAIECAERALLTARARLETAAPSVTLRGLSECEIQIGEERVTLKPDESREQSVADRLTISIPHRVTIDFAAGSSSDELTRDVDDARKVLEGACRLAGVNDPDSARMAFDERRDAIRKIQDKERYEQENLRDLSYDDITDKLLLLQQTVPNYLTRRTRTPAIAVDLDRAKIALEESESTLQDAHTEWEHAQKAVDAARKVRDELSRSNEQLLVQRRTLETAIKQHRSRLEVARKAVSDDALASSAEAAGRSVKAEARNVETTESTLSARNPDRIKTLVETAENTLRTIKIRREAAKTELTEVQTRLSLRGEEGLHEKLQAARIQLETTASEHRSLFRRASAAKRLYDLLCEERGKARQAYVAPLKCRIERLGRLVFDTSFQVELNEDLQITARITDGIRVPFDSLSGGTKEQLSLIFRLACSMIVAEEGGMPLIMDDALGYTDPERLRLMGAVLATAAKECQIVIFTCVPDRYANVGNASIVSL